MSPKILRVPHLGEADWEEARCQQALVEGWAFEEQQDGSVRIFFPEPENGDVWYAHSLAHAVAAISLEHEPDDRREAPD